jgi:16S rRNA (guanine966-N2)-methyltransferase
VRVIAGTAKGRKLIAPQGYTTRPTPARVREALFSIIAAHVPHAQVLDLYAGTGALGLEALSRGADNAVFVERDRHVLDCLRRNVEPFAVRLEVLSMAVKPALALLGQRRGRFDVIFMDPPYPLNLWSDTLADIARYALLAPDGIVVCEHPSAGGALDSPAELACVRTRAFGEVTLSLFAKP